MKTRVALIGVALILLVFAVLAVSSRQVQAQSFTQWEYAQVGYLTDKHQAAAAMSDSDTMQRFNDDFAAIFKDHGEQTLAVNYLDKMGERGWELVTAVDTSDGTVFTFKRSIQ